MRTLLFAAAALAAFATPALAADDATDRAGAIALCQAEVQSRTDLTAEQVRLDSVRTRPRLIRVDLDVWNNGALQNVSCDVRRGDQLEIAEIEPSLQTASR